MHGYFDDLKVDREAIFSPSLGCVILFSLLGLVVSAAVLVLTAPQSLDEILAMLG